MRFRVVRCAVLFAVPIRTGHPVLLTLAMAAFVFVLPARPSSGADEAADGVPRVRELRRMADEAMRRGAYGDAAGALERLGELLPRDAFLRYNLACARAMGGDAEGAEDALREAFARGFIDLFHLERDEQLDAIRGRPMFRAVIGGWRELTNTHGERQLAGMKERFMPGPPPDRYTFESDPVLRLHFASSFRAESFREAREQVTRVAAWASRELFPAPADTERSERPDPWVCIVLPTPIDFFKMVMSEGVGGYYDRDRRRLVTQDLGPTLRHEFLHVLHWRYAERLGQRHPLWIMEGLACLPEDVEMPGEASSGVFEFKASWRTNIVRRLVKLGGLQPLERFCALPDIKFMGQRPRANYAQARAVMMFLHSEGKLGAWFAAYTRRWKEDPTGLKALEEVLDLPAARIDHKLRVWALTLPESGEQSRPAKFGLGVSVSGGRGDGVLIDRVVTGSRLSRGLVNPLRFKDVILEIQGQPVRSLDDYARILGELQEGIDPPPAPAPRLDDPFAEPEPRTGPKVKVKVRRSTREVELEVTLVEIPEGLWAF